MFSQLAKQSAKALPADLCTDDAHYVKIRISTVLRGNKNMVVEGGTVCHYYILVIREFIDFMSLFPHSVWFSFSVKQIPFKVASRYRAFSSSCGLFIRIVLNFNFGFKVLTDRNKRSEML